MKPRAALIFCSAVPVLLSEKDKNGKLAVNPGPPDTDDVSPKVGNVNAALIPLYAVKVELTKPTLALMRPSEVTEDDRVEVKNGSTAVTVSSVVAVTDNVGIANPKSKALPVAALSDVSTNPMSILVGASLYIVADKSETIKLAGSAFHPQREPTEELINPTSTVATYP